MVAVQAQLLQKIAAQAQLLQRIAAWAPLILVTALIATGASAAEVTYTDIAPILQQRCVMCHSGPAAPRGLHLDSLEGLLAGSDQGPVALSGDPDASKLIRRLKGSDVPRMPMTGPPYLSDAEITLFEDWILAGMKAGPEPPEQTVAAVAVEKEFVTFDQVAVIFATRCAKCHTDNGLMGDPPEGYRLTSYASVISASHRVRVLPGQPEASELLRRIRGQAQPRMPFDGPPYLDAEEIALIEQWIADGARDSAGVAAPIPVGARIRLHGTLRGRWQLDDLPLNITSETRIDDSPRAGEQVRIRGQVQADGSIRVDRVQTR